MCSALQTLRKVKIIFSVICNICPSGVGFSTGDVKLNRLPGWEAHSYGYHGDDGNAFQGSGTGKHYGPVYATGQHSKSALHTTAC